MKITKTKLKQIIQEELSAVLGEENGTPSCEDLLKRLKHAKAEMAQHDPRQMGMAGGLAPYDMEGEYSKAAEIAKEIKAEMVKNGCTKEAAPTTAKEAGGHTFSSDAGSQQAALNAWRPGK